MRHKLYWFLFLSFIFAGIIFYSGYTAVLLWRYLSLDHMAPVQEVRWSIVSTSEESYFPQADYHFQSKGKQLTGHTVWHESFLNEWTAQEYINQHLSHEVKTVWYDPSSPQDSTMEKRFPYKECFSVLTLWFIGLYFVSLDFYIRRRYQ